MLQTRLLVDYDSEDGSEGSGVSTGGNEENCATFQPLVVKRKLPALSTTLTGTAHTDDPSLHQGRTRTRPHVDGQWAAHVYVCLRLHRSAKDMISRIVADAMMRVQELQPLSDVERGELHVSLTRPIYLLEHQRRDLVQEVSRIARCTQPSVSCSKDESLFLKRNPASFSFKMSCSTVSSFQNDERTRVFLALNVGAGHTELKSMSDAIDRFLLAVKQDVYYANPQYHASFCWALLSLPPDQPPDLFPRIPEMPAELPSQLNSCFLEEARNTLIFDITEVTLKIGKEIHSCPLGS